MPMLKKTPFFPSVNPDDLKPDEMVYQIRFTKEIFRDYSEYLKRLNMYRQRVWTCKISGKSNFTYEEALVSEKFAIQKAQQFPKEFIAPVLQLVQFSMLSLTDLINQIRSKLQEDFKEGSELYGRKDNCIMPCNIIKVIVDDENTRYEVAWLDLDKVVIEKAIVDESDLIHQKVPFSRNLLKSFIRESTRQSCPWLIYHKLAVEHAIPTDPPEELKRSFSFQNGLFIKNKKRKIDTSLDSSKENDGPDLCKVKNLEKNGDVKERDVLLEAIKYPIDDLLVPHNDSVLLDRPSPSRDFIISIDCFGELLMIWDFCCSFSRLLQLWPFSLKDFENAICYKDDVSVLIFEAHASVMRLLIRNGDEPFSVMRKKKTMISLLTWEDYLCDFLDIIDIPELSVYISTIKRGHYGLLDTHAKLGILRELVLHAVTTDLVREQLDDNIIEKQSLVSTRRVEAGEEAKKKKEEKELMKTELGGVNVNGIKAPQNGAFKQNFENGNEGDVHKLGIPSKLQKDTSNISGEKCESENVKIGTNHKKDIFEREIEKLIIRSNPLGKDRHYNRYWFFRRDGRVFVESSDSKLWGYYSTKNEIDALMSSLNCKGIRESALHKQLNKSYGRICSELEKSRREEEKKKVSEEVVLRRSSRVKSNPKYNPAIDFMNYTNKLNPKEPLR